MSQIFFFNNFIKRNIIIEKKYNNKRNKSNIFNASFINKQIYI